MFAIIEGHHNEVTLKNNTRQISSITSDSQMNLIRNTFHYTDMTTFLSSWLLSSRLCKSAESLKYYAVQIASQKEITSRQNGRKEWPRNVG